MKKTPYEKIRNQINDLTKKLLLIQDTCKHPENYLEKKYKSDTGNYDRSLDEYWIDFKCDYCGKTWKESQ